MSIKTNRDKFIYQMLDQDYSFDEVHEFADEHLQNLLSLEENISNFIKWVK